MCGIVAYLGDKQAAPILIDGLYKLEYRGYDSAGISVIEKGQIGTYKCKGKVGQLDRIVDQDKMTSTIGIAHTRWATHGPPNDVNAHPHNSQSGTISLVHNGIIENYQTWKKILVEEGYEFKSDTDTEVIAHLLEYFKKKYELSTEDALRQMLKKVVGAYAIVIIDEENPDILLAARKSSPLVFGIGKDEYFIASDATPIGQYTDQFIFLEDDQIISIDRKEGYRIFSLDNETVSGEIKEIDVQIEEIEKGGYPHFMLKEIHQQPQTIADSMRGRFNLKEQRLSVGGLLDHIEKISKMHRIILVACGTSWHTALVAEYLFEDIARISCEVEYASEFRYRNPIIDENDLVIAISQSGETADTLAALSLAKERGAMTYGVVNVVGSSISRVTDTGSYTHAGPEIGVASTKAFTSQLTVLTLMAIQLGRHLGRVSDDDYQAYMHSLDSLGAKAGTILTQDDKIKYIASEIKSASNALYLGRGYNFPVALEGALKLKEISYIHAEGYPAAEMKHGPIALIDLYMPVIVIATNESIQDKLISNIEEVKARKGLIIAVINEGDEKIKAIADYYIEIPPVKEALSPILSAIPLQLLAYHIAVMRGCDVDQPRNLAKSVTVE